MRRCVAPLSPLISSSSSSSSFLRQAPWRFNIWESFTTVIGNRVYDLPVPEDNTPFITFVLGNTVGAGLHEVPFTFYILPWKINLSFICAFGTHTPCFFEFLA
ncbi:hypothetical protein SLEP1_g28096 [Rubroshorea leprosula]|uniref:Uncharacterized protein n=1 Tax=Rubroshorea leprosula TaxID=152421 RepID=A0AAV5JY51_9ROSI|nr:hypothetical protein SLEP1_g28096 [Rubroshorea leprosula]